MQFRDFSFMQKLSGLFLFAVLISGAFSSSFAFAQIGPTVEDDFYTINEDSTLIIDSLGVLLNDTSTDGDLFAIIQTSVGFGTLTLNLNGSFTYQPNQNFDSFDSFTYFATNGTLDSNNATVTLFVNPINDSPIAQNDTATTPEETPVIIPVLNNDSDIDGDTLAVDSVTQGTNGTVTTNGTTVTYTPTLNFNGTDSFTYTISDGVNTSNSAMITVTVTPIDDEDANEHDNDHNNEHASDHDKGHANEHDDKINICHKDKKTITVSENAVPAHLKHGDTLGTCSNENDDDEVTDKKAIENQIKSLKKEFKAQEKELKKEFKAQEKELKKEFKAQEKELKSQLKDSKKDKKSHDDD
jgi:VCBS repeat-containing protein